MPTEAQTDEVSAKRAELAARVEGILGEVELFEECMEIVTKAQESGGDVDAAIKKVREKLGTRLSELDREGAALEDCLETLDEHIAQGVSGGLPGTRVGLVGRLSVVNCQHDALTRCVETLGQYKSS